MQDKWKDGARNTMESGGRKIGENKLLSKKKRCERAGPPLHIRTSVSSGEGQPGISCMGLPVLPVPCCDAVQKSTFALVCANLHV